MPLTILELVVKATVTEGNTAVQPTSLPASAAANTAMDLEVLTAEIVEQVLAIIDAKQER